MHMIVKAIHCLLFYSLKNTNLFAVFFSTLLYGIKHNTYKIKNKIIGLGY